MKKNEFSYEHQSNTNEDNSDLSATKTTNDISVEAKNKIDNSSSNKDLDHIKSGLSYKAIAIGHAEEQIIRQAERFGRAHSFNQSTDSLVKAALGNRTGWSDAINNAIGGHAPFSELLNRYRDERVERVAAFNRGADFLVRAASGNRNAWPDAINNAIGGRTPFSELLNKSRDEKLERVAAFNRGTDFLVRAASGNRNAWPDAINNAIGGHTPFSELLNRYRDERLEKATAFNHGTDFLVRAALGNQSVWSDALVRAISGQPLLAGLAKQQVSSKFLSEYLTEFDEEDFSTLRRATKEFSRTPQGAALIAINLRNAEQEDPESWDKFKDFIDGKWLFDKFSSAPMFLKIIIFYMFSTFSSIVQDQVENWVIDVMKVAQKGVSNSLSPSPYIKQLKKNLKPIVFSSYINEFRITTASSLRLRNAPSMNADSVVSIEKFTPVLVIDNSNRKWLHVQVSINGQKVYGWVNRAHTKKIEL